MDRARYYANALLLLPILLIVTSSLAQNCGKRKVANFLIVNGTEPKEGYWPWHAALYLKSARSSEYACGGTILDHNTVLTAAHCLVSSNGIIARKRLVVHVGRYRLSVASNRAQEHEAFQLIVHPEHNINRIEHDIALVMLATDITYTDYIQPICLWNRGEDQNAIIGSLGTVVGFGIDETDNVSDTLREASVPVVSHMTCIESNREVFAYQLTSNMLCAGNRDGISACNGDSGGGLFFNYTDVWFIRGIVSFTKPRGYGYNCDAQEYTVFTDVAKYLRWIEQHMGGTGCQPIETRIKNSHKIKLLPMLTCGANPYAVREELSKPVLLGYPWLGLVECLETKSNKIETNCQAILISDLYLITNAYCFSSDSCNKTSVRLGEYDMNKTKDCAQVEGQLVCSPSVQTIRIESVIKHMEYKSHKEYRNLQANDIALIRLQNRADTSQSNVKPICLPVTNELRSQKSTHYTVAAWNDKPDYSLLHRSLRELIDLTECQKLYNTTKRLMQITTRQICIKQQQQNDSKCMLPMAGAALQLVQQVQGTSRYVLYGVLSYGPPKCGEPYPDVYTNVASYMDWILENIQE